MKRLVLLAAVAACVCCASCGRAERSYRVKGIYGKTIAIRNLDTLYKVGDTVRLSGGLDGEQGIIHEVTAVIVGK